MENIDELSSEEREKLRKEHNREWYRKTYFNLIEKARNRNPKDLIYLEKHHIIPKCCGGSNDESNLVCLTYKEHVLAHKLLIRFMDYNRGLYLAVGRLMSIEVTENGIKIKKRIKSIREVEEIKKMYSDASRGENHPNWGNHLSEETKRKIGDAQRGEKNHMWGKHPSEETRNKLSKAKIGNKNNSVWTEERRLRASVRQKELYASLSSEEKERRRQLRKGKKASKETKNLLSKIRREQPSSKVNILAPDGFTVFNTIKQAALFADVCEDTMRKWVKSNPEKGYRRISKNGDIIDPIKPIKSPLPRKGRRIIDKDGNIYESQKEASRKTGIPRTTLQTWIKKFPEKGFRWYNPEEDN